jgi:hypothetical protein
MLSDALKFWDAISGKVKEMIRSETNNAMRVERYDVTTAPNGTVMGVTKPLGTHEIFLPYSSEVRNAKVNDPVLVAWWGSMSNAKVYYFANGYNGGLAAYPVGSYYWSSVNVSPANIFGGQWERVNNVFLLAAGTSYSVGNGVTKDGGEATVTLQIKHMPAHTHDTYYNNNVNASGSNRRNPTGASGDSTLSPGTGSTGGGEAHNNMPPYVVAYCWHRYG